MTHPEPPTDKLPEADAQEADISTAVIRHQDGVFMLLLEAHDVHLAFTRDQAEAVIASLDKGISQLDLWLSLERRHRKTIARENPLDK